MCHQDSRGRWLQVFGAFLVLLLSPFIVSAETKSYSEPEGYSCIVLGQDPYQFLREPQALIDTVQLVSGCVKRTKDRPDDGAFQVLGTAMKYSPQAIRELREYLRDPDYRIRVRALSEFTMSGSTANYVLPELEEIARGQNVGLRFMSAKAIGGARKWTEPQLRKMFRDKDGDGDSLFAVAASFAGLRSTEIAMTLLKEARVYQAQSFVEDAIAHLKPLPIGIRAELRGRIVTSNGDCSNLFHFAELGLAVPSDAPEMTRIISNGGKCSSAAAMVLMSIGKLSPNEYTVMLKGIHPSTRTLDYDDPLPKEITTCDRSVIPALLEMSHDPDPHRRIWAYRALVYFVDDPQAAARIMEIIDDQEAISGMPSLYLKGSLIESFMELRPRLRGLGKALLSRTLYGPPPLAATHPRAYYLDLFKLLSPLLPVDPRGTFTGTSSSGISMTLTSPRKKYRLSEPIPLFVHVTNVTDKPLGFVDPTCMLAGNGAVPAHFIVIKDPGWIVSYASVTRNSQRLPLSDPKDWNMLNPGETRVYSYTLKAGPYGPWIQKYNHTEFNSPGYYFVRYTYTMSGSFLPNQCWAPFGGMKGGNPWLGQSYSNEIALTVD